MMKSRYWSCSTLADRIRGTAKLKAATAREWQEWEQQAKTAHPIRWWIAEEALDRVQDFVTWPMRKLYDIKYYINNRWVTRTHALTAHPRDIPRGEWRDVGNRFLPCLFNELRDFVEVELAWWHLAWNSEDRHKYDAPWWAFGWFRWRTWRCPQAGLDNLKWQSELRWSADELGEDSDLVGKPTYQAEKALEIIALYKWWTEVYPNRPDPYDASGWTAYCDLNRDSVIGFLSKDADPNTAAISDLAHKKLREIEAAYEAEDEEMLIRLIRIRNSLWT